MLTDLAACDLDDGESALVQVGGIVTVMMLVAAQRAPIPAAAVHGIATIFAMIQGSVHFMSMGLLHGLRRGGIGEAQDAMNAVRDPRRISNFNMARLWTIVALAVH